jgi:uncharacterized membrane protein YcaP (DUF421 family)
MELNWFWEALLIFFVGTFILRVGGRKSISQMTMAQIVVMIGLGSLIIQPITGRGLLITFLAALVLVVVMVIVEYFEVKVDMLENIFSGKAVMIVENGQPIIKDLKKQRLSIDRVEMRLRQAGITSMEDVLYATIEVNGELGYELKDNKKPVVKEDLDKLMNEISLLKAALGINTDNQGGQNQNQAQNQKNNIFKEVKTKQFEGDGKEP